MGKNVLHDYAINEKYRRDVLIYLVILYIALALLGTVVWENVVSNIVEDMKAASDLFTLLYTYGKCVIPIILPITGFGVFYYIYDHYIWKCKWLYAWHNIPDLNGEWSAEVISSLKEGTPRVSFTIRQTWSGICVEGISSVNKKQTISDTASIVQKDGKTIFGYSYRIKDNNNSNSNHDYIGYNALVYKNDTLEGQYYSGRDVEKDFSDILDELTKEQKSRILDKLKGCGAKGTIILKKVR